MDLELAGKKALILSSSQGIGLGIAESLAMEGVDVMLTARSSENLEKAIKKIKAFSHVQADYLAADMSKKSFVGTILAACKHKLGGIDILINNTPGPAMGKVRSFGMEVWNKNYETMVQRVIELSNKTLDHMIERKWGRIITIGSSGIEQPILGLGLSNALRAALAGYSKTLASEVAHYGITVNMVLPGRIDTKRLVEIDKNSAEKLNISLEEARNLAIQQIPAARYGKPSEMADLVTFLASKRASYITGSMIRCDGGAIRSI